MEDESERRITSVWRLFCETLLTPAGIWTARPSILKFRKLGTPCTSCRSYKWSSLFVKDDVLPELADLKDVRVKFSSRSDAVVAHPSGFVISRTERDRGQEEDYALQLHRVVNADGVNVCASMQGALTAGDFLHRPAYPQSLWSLMSSRARQ